MINDSTPLQKGDLIITVIFHLKDRPKLVEVEMTPGQKRLDMPELCSSFLVAVAEEDEIDLLSFDECVDAAAHEEPLQEKQPEEGDEGEDRPAAEPVRVSNSNKRSRPVVFELFGDGSDLGLDPVTGIVKTIRWSLIRPEMDAMQHLRIISTASFRHVYSDPRVQKVFSRDECIERCRLLSGHTPFPVVLVETNLDLLANGLMVGWLPETCPDDFALVMEDRGLTHGFITREQFERKADYDRRLKMTKKRLNGVLETASKYKTLHHLSKLGHAVRIGHLGIVIESGIVVGGAAYDAVYDPNNLVKNAKRRSKIGIASTVGAAVGGGLGILIPIPGLFVLMSMGGSIAGRWIAGKFVTEDGVEHDDVIPVGRLRDDEDAGVLEVTQELDEEDPQWMVTWNNLQSKVGLGDAPKQPTKSQSAPSFWERVTGTGAPPPSMPVLKDGDLLSFEGDTKKDPDPKIHQTAEDDSGEGDEEDDENDESDERHQKGSKEKQPDADEEVSKRPVVMHVPDRQMMRGSPDTGASTKPPVQEAPKASSSWWPLGGGGAAPSMQAPKKDAAAVAPSPPASAGKSAAITAQPVDKATPPPAASSAPPQSSSSSSSSWWPWGSKASSTAPQQPPQSQQELAKQPPPSSAPKPVPPSVQPSKPPPPNVHAPSAPRSNSAGAQELLSFDTATATAGGSATSLLFFEEATPAPASFRMDSSPSLLSFDDVQDEKPAELLSFDDLEAKAAPAPMSGGSLLSFDGI